MSNSNGLRHPAQLRPGDHVVVIGAGPAGLTAAYALTKDGVNVTVLEADDTVGGLSRTAQYKGYLFDIGGHRFFTKVREVEDLWREILGDEFKSVRRLSRIHYNGRFFDYPLKPANALRGIGLVNAVWIVLSYLKWHYRPHPVEETFEQWVTNRFGKRLYEIFFKTYTEKVWGVPCSEIRAEWAAQRIQGLSLARALITATQLNARPAAIRTLIHAFNYPRLGPGQMWEACRKHVERLGGCVLLRHRITRVEHQGGRVTCIGATTAAGDVRLVKGDHFISTMPLRSLVRAFQPAAPPEVRDAAEGLRYRDFVMVALIVDGEDLFPDNWVYVHTPGLKVGRVQNFNNWSPDMVPESGRTCLGLEYFCFKGDGLWERSDRELVDLATSELRQLGLARNAPVVDGTVVRMPKAYPIYDASYRGNLDIIRAFIDGLTNFHSVGRNGMHKYNNQDHSMMAALLAVRTMRGHVEDVWNINTDFEYHEEQRLQPPLEHVQGPAGKTSW
ncbi:MAG TPA: NAD(P)/FAD-dependent oxidoreductase [Vicinamibacterales bacterium]|jgi:protoporphyrinogen oxidase|nr:NAD(P)/FAD-dependent oxidoreductase [Vicinamibacterales bacterium]